MVEGGREGRGGLEEEGRMNRGKWEEGEWGFCRCEN